LERASKNGKSFLGALAIGVFDHFAGEEKVEERKGEFKFRSIGCTEERELSTS